MASLAEILKNAGREGWSVIGSRPAEETVTDTSTYPPTTKKQPIPGQWIWTISSGKPGSQADEITVSTAQATAGATEEGPGFDLIEGPKHSVPQEKPPEDWRTGGKWIEQPDGSKRWQAFNPATGRTEDVPGGPAPLPATERNKPEPKTVSSGGVVYERQEDGTYKPAQGIPAEPTKAEAPIFREFEGKLYRWVPDPSKPGGGTLQLAEGLEQGGHPPGYFIEGGYKVYKTWNEGTKKYEVDPSQPPEAWSPEAQAQAAKTAAQPKEGDTRKNISGGYHVTQTYKGGEWTTTEIGEKATPSEPTTIATSTEQPYIARTDAQGNVAWVPNENYQGPKAPTTRGELAQRVAQLQSQAQQMRDKIAADKAIPPDQQSARFLQWYDQNVAPQVGALEQQQQAIITDEAQKALEAQRAGLTAAANAIQSTAPYRVGPGYGQAFENIVGATARGERAKNVDLAGVSTYKAPSIDQSVQDLLAGKAATAPTPGMDFQSLLNRNQWVPGGGAAAAAGAAGAAAPPAPVVTPEQQANRAAAGAQLAAASANPANSPFGKIAANPMLEAIQARNRALASQQTAVATAQAQTPFGALNAMPRAGAMPMASGEAPLAYNPGAFSGVMPLLPGFDYSQLQTQWQPS